MPARTPRVSNVRGYEEEGTITTPFDTVVLKRIDHERDVERAARTSTEGDHG